MSQAVAAPSVAQDPRRPGVLDLGPGAPDPALLPVDGLARAAVKAWNRHAPETLGYGDARGPWPLRSWLAARFSTQDGVDVDPDDIVITAGASHGLQMLGLLLGRPGAVVLVERPTYDRGLDIFRELGLTPRGVPCDERGLIPEALAQAAADARVRGEVVAFVYCQPAFQNPTGSTSDGDRRRDIVHAAAVHDLVVVEDEAYRELPFGGPPPPSLWAVGGDRRTFRVGSFAKTAGPGTRVGWIAGAPELVERLAGSAVLYSGGGIAHLAALALGEWCESGQFDLHLEQLRRGYAARARELSAALAAHDAPASWREAEGGFFLWLTLHVAVTAEALGALPAAYGIDVFSGSRFLDTHDGRAEMTLRLSFSGYEAEQLGVAGARLAQALRVSYDRAQKST